VVSISLYYPSAQEDIHDSSQEDEDDRRPRSIGIPTVVIH
jgi:hypothetical protein